MSGLRSWSDTEQEQAEADRQTESLAGLAMALAIVVISLFLIHALHAKEVIEDCLLAGRHNCDMYVTHPAPPNLDPN